MVSARDVVYYAFHPNQVRAMVQWKIWHEPVHKRQLDKETESEKTCFEYLELTSRSFAAVIQELNPELLMPVCLFYLVLRGLDTIEDDMTLDLKTKEPLLRKFHENMQKPGWNFKDSGPNEKDRELLVNFDQVIVELQKVKKPYYAVIHDICTKMGNGMADYARNAEFNANGVETIKDYELYCHYVAGIVGDGLTRLFVESKLANPALLNRPELTESMGQMLQKTNIIRDIREDWDDRRRFWPKEIWSKYVSDWEDLFKPEHQQSALHCQSEMVLNALKHADQCLFYMAGIRDQSVFNFVAIPQSMAMATLELCFRNPDMFKRNIKITKGDACKLMTLSTQNLKVLCRVYRDYVRRIHKKNDPTDPNYFAISVQCGKIEQFIETLYPSQNVKLIQAGQKQREGEPSMDTMEAIYLILAVLAVFAVIGGLMVGTAWLLSSQFEKVFNGTTTGVTTGATPGVTTLPPITHGEL